MSYKMHFSLSATRIFYDRDRNAVKMPIKLVANRMLLQLSVLFYWPLSFAFAKNKYIVTDLALSAQKLNKNHILF